MPSRLQQRQGLPGAAPWCPRWQARRASGHGAWREVGGPYAPYLERRRVFEPTPSNEVLVYSPILANSATWGRVLAGPHERYPSSTRLTASC